MEIILIFAGLATIYGMLCMWLFEWYERPRPTKAPKTTLQQLRQEFSDIPDGDVVIFDSEGGFRCTRLSNPKN